MGTVLGRFERRGLKLVALKMQRISEDLAREYYGEHVGKAFFPGLVAYVTSGPVVAMVWEGPGAVETARSVIGATDPRKAAPGSVRGDYGLDIARNLIHGADSAASAKREIALFFRPEELLAYERIDEGWLTGP